MMLWLSTFNSLSEKVKLHFDTLQVLLLDLMTEHEVDLDDNSESEEGYKEYQSSLMHKFHSRYPEPSSADCKNFFVRTICEDNSTFFLDESYLKEKGLLNYRQREDGKGMRVVSQSTASINPSKPVVRSYEVSAINGTISPHLSNLR